MEMRREECRMDNMCILKQLKNGDLFTRFSFDGKNDMIYTKLYEKDGMAYCADINNNIIKLFPFIHVLACEEVGGSFVYWDDMN